MPPGASSCFGAVDVCVEERLGIAKWPGVNRAEKNEEGIVERKRKGKGDRNTKRSWNIFSMGYRQLSSALISCKLNRNLIYINW